MIKLCTHIVVRLTRCQIKLLDEATDRQLESSSRAQTNQRWPLLGHGGVGVDVRMYGTTEKGSGVYS